MSVKYRHFLEFATNDTCSRCEFEFDVPLTLCPGDKLNVVLWTQPDGSQGGGHYINRAHGGGGQVNGSSPADLLLRELPEMGCWSFLPDAFKHRVMALINKEQV